MATWSKEVFAKNLKRYMEKKEISQKELSVIVGVSAPTINEWVKAKKYPRIDKIEILSNYFGCLKSDLIEEKTEEQLNMEKNNDITFDDFTYAMYNETKDLTDEDKEALLSMARILKKKTEH